MNSLIEQTFDGFTVDGVEIPVAFLNYDGRKTTYIVYQNVDKDHSLSGDGDLLNYIDYYDFDVYSKGNYLAIIEELKRKLKEVGFAWSPSRTSPDIYEPDTKYYHKTLCFGYCRTEEN